MDFFLGGGVKIKPLIKVWFEPVDLYFSSNQININFFIGGGYNGNSPPLYRSVDNLLKARYKALCNYVNINISNIDEL